MTRCCRDDINLKSSAYNQTGQSYVDQLSLHRSMCTHLRRVLLAKSVVDSRNPKYINAMHNRYKPSSCKSKFLEECPSNEIIEKLTYNTEHRPSEIIKVHPHRKMSSKERTYINDRNCPCLQLKIAKSKYKYKKSEDYQNYMDQDIKDIASKRWKFSNSKYESSAYRTNRQRNEGKCMCSARSGNDSFYPPRDEKKRTNEYENRWDDKSFGKYVQRGEEEARYAKFVYDITQDIVRNGLYTDKELKEVFEKHLERSSRYLNKRKMLYEIYQLKISLNIMDDSEEDETEADLVFAEKFSKLQIPKPPTPPKILNENKILEKLQSFKEQKNKIHKPNSLLGRKSVVLIDANPEFMVTERDVLSTLMDNHVDPEQIQRIYRHLFQRSKDMSLCEAVQVGKEVSYTHRLKQIDRGISTISLDNAYIKERLQGILRNENKTDLDEISTQTMYYKNDYINNKRDEISETFEQLKNDECDCKLIKRIDYNEKEIQPSFFKIPIQKINSFNKKFNIIDKKITNKRSELLKSRSNKIEYHQTNNVSENLQRLNDNSTDKNKNSSAVDNGDFYQIALIEENERVQEEIESNISNLSEKSKMSSTTQKEDKSFNEDENKDDSTSIVSEMSHESLKYSDNFSNASESNSNIDINFITNVKLPLSVSKDKVNKQRYFSIKDYVDNLGLTDNKATWKLKSSSDSSSISILSGTKVISCTTRPESIPTKTGTVNRTIKKRTSWGISGFKAINTWNEKMTELSNDFHTSPTYYCNTKCRVPAVDKICADSCKFVKMNCKNFPKPTNCLNKVESSNTSNSL